VADRPPRGTYELSSVDRALQVLDILAATPRLRLAEISERLGANPSTVLRALRVLEGRGLVRRAPTDVEYVLGARLVELGRAAVTSLDLAHALREAARPVAASLDATAHIGMVRAGMITVVDKIDPPRSPVQYSSVGSRMPLHATAAGKAALALGARLEHADLPAFTPRTIVHRSALDDDIARTAARRYSIEFEEYHRGFACVGSALAAGDDIHTVSISGSADDPSTLEEWGARLRDAVDAVQREHRGAVRGL
jgi:Transcriptional regulator